jgi:hypothetical protein
MAKPLTTRRLLTTRTYHSGFGRPVGRSQIGKHERHGAAHVGKEPRRRPSRLLCAFVSSSRGSRSETKLSRGEPKRDQALTIFVRNTVRVDTRLRQIVCDAAVRVC